MILASARNDFPIIGQPNVLIFESAVTSLKQQTFKDFELIVVDAFYPSRKNYFDSLKCFPVKYVPVHPNHSFWRKHKRWNLCGALNTGIIHAEGELLVRIDDCSQFNPDFLEKFWAGYKKGVFPLAMHTRYRNGKQAIYNAEYKKEGYDFKKEKEDYGAAADKAKILDTIFKEGDHVRDTRWPIVEARGGSMIAPIPWFYGYSSMSLEAALTVNGFNELFDGDKGQEDQDMGMRLHMAGYRSMFNLNVNHWVIEHEHEAVPEEIVARDTGNIKCNYAIYKLAERKGRWKANSIKMSEEDLKYVREISLQKPCSPHQNFYLGNCSGELWDLWKNSQPIFDLREERIFNT